VASEGRVSFIESHIRYNLLMSSGELIREARLRHGLSQERLARRAGTKQSAISRLEADEVSPGIDTLGLLMAAMGERLEIAAAPLERDYDPAHRRATAARPPGERLALGISWNRMAGRLAAAGRQARARH
jgi:HTH-type transcriptional regulator/antitoxin HipB